MLAEAAAEVELVSALIDSVDRFAGDRIDARAIDRAHRIDQTQHVHVYRLVANDTIEEKVMELKARKAELFAQVIDGDGAMSTSIGAEDIRGLFE